MHVWENAIIGLVQTTYCYPIGEKAMLILDFILIKYCL